MADKFGTIVECNYQKAKNGFADRMKPDAITLFCEDRKELAVLGEWGGDGYPVVWYGLKGNIKYGIALAADGVGNGAFVHKSLQEFVSSERTESDKLKKFLTAIYGEEFFEDEEAVEYAVKSFCSLPPNGYYGTNTELGQVNKPFYEKDSQYLSSRIVCIAIFYKFRKFFENKDLTPENVSVLRKEIQTYLDGVSDENGELIEVSQFRQNILTVFNNQTDGVKIMDRIKYFLPCTAAMWFFKSDESKDSEPVNACVVYAGDARAYKLDLEDGVMQISVDDAEDDGAMTCCIRYCSKRNFREDTKEHDCALKASYVEIKKPCALFACSDGVYDTCLPKALDGNNKKGIPAVTHSSLVEYQSYDSTNDIAFEYNYQEMLRRCYSLDDILTYTAKHIYYHAGLDDVSAGGIYSKVTESGNPYSIKRDDSATLAMVFFGKEKNGFPAVINKLRTAKTSLDRLIDELKEGSKDGKYSYCKPPQEDTADTVKKEVLKTFTLNKEFNDFLKKCASEDSAKVCATATQNMWGITEYQVKNPLMGMSLDMFLKPRKAKVVDVLLDDVKELKERTAEVKVPEVPVQEIKDAYGRLLQTVRECAEWKASEKDIKKAYEEAEKKEEDARKIREFLERKKRAEEDSGRDLGYKFGRKPSDGEENSEEDGFIDKITRAIFDQVHVWGDLINECDGIINLASEDKEFWRKEKNKFENDSMTKLLKFNNECSNVFKALDKQIKKRADDELIGRWEDLKRNDRSGFFSAVSSSWSVSVDRVDFEKLVEYLPEDIAKGIEDSKFIPDGWDETSHILISKERYDELNEVIKTIVPSLEGAWEIESYVEKETEERIKNSPFKKVSDAYNAYVEIAYARRGDQPLVKGERYESIYQTFNRGIDK